METTPFDKLVEIFEAEPRLSRLPDGTPLPRDFQETERVLGYMVDHNPEDAIYIAEGSTINSFGSRIQFFSIKYSSVVAHDKALQISVNKFDELNACSLLYKYSFQELWDLDLAEEIVRAHMVWPKI